ncbi:hypothetical protein GF337_19945, partial [candidate division KSB1 bacterium]|nr:hypothetical protein [candidate division KSB1 bacterium]
MIENGFQKLPSRWIYAFALIILAGAVLIRYINILGDAPVGDISRSGVFYVDEGTYAHNVVNKILYDKWFMPDDYNAMSNVPVFSIFQYVLLRLFGLSLITLRIPGIIYTLVSLALLWFFLKRRNMALAFIFLILAGSNYFFLIFNRLALLENLLLMFLVLVTICLFKYRETNSIKWLLSAIFIYWAGFFIKATILFFLPLLLFVILTNPVGKWVRIRHLYIYALFSTLLLIMAYIFWIIPHKVDWTYFETRNIYQNIDESSLIFIINYARYFTNLKLFQFMPVTYLVFLVSLFYYLYELLIIKKVAFLELFFIVWAISAFVFLGFFTYSPPRHSLILIIPIMILTGSFLIKMYTNRITFADKNIYLILLPISILSMAQIGFGLYRILEYEQNYLSCYLPLLSLVIIPFFYLWMKKKINIRYAAIILFGMMIFLNSFQIIRYHMNVEYSYYDAIIDMKKTIEKEEVDNEIVLGDIAPLISVELRTKAVNIIFKKDTEHKRILKNRPGLLVLQENSELDRLYKKLPDYFDEIELIR